MVLREEDWPALEKEYEKLADIYLERQLEGWGEKFNFFHFRMDLYRGPCMAKRLVVVVLVTNIWAIVPNGDIYPCHQFVGKDGYVLAMCMMDYKIQKFLKTSVIHMYSLNQLVLNVGRNSSVLVVVMLTTLH